MNKPAPKEPSMDEILSSIRQIIADDDAATLPKRLPPRILPLGSAPPPIRPVLPLPAARPILPSFRPAEPEPLALSAEQILHDDEDDEEAMAPLSFSALLAGTPVAEPGRPLVGEGEFVDPEDNAFETDEPEAPAFVPAPVVPPVFARPAYTPSPPPVLPRPAPKPAVSVAQAAPMPDPTLARDLAEELLEPATQSAVKSTLSRLNGLANVGSGVTLEDMMREMLKPMLKEWLDENLPAVVERMVEKEIARVSRGGY